MAGAAGLCVAVAMPVQAQECTAPVAVFDQPREGLDPHGPDIAACRLFPPPTVSGTSEANLFTEANGQQGDLITALTAALGARRARDRQHFTVKTRWPHHPARR